MKYPDIIVGKITINSTAKEIKLVANSSGKIHLFSDKFLSDVKENEPIAYIQNTVSYDTIIKIKNSLSDFLTSPQYTEVLKKLPNKITLGELTVSYYDFLSNVEQLYLYETEKLYDVQINNLQHIYQKQLRELHIFQERLAIDENYYIFAKKIHRRDSLLFSSQTVAEADMDKSNMTLLQTKNNITSDKENFASMEKQTKQTTNTIKELTTQKAIKYNDLKTNIITSYNKLMEEINKWEHLYIIKSPIKGKVQTLNFWTENQYVTAGTEVFSVIPTQEKSLGQMLLPTLGAGKVKVGQEVVVKLDDFPYLEYGSVRGTVISISMSKKEEKTTQGEMEVYLVLVQFNEGLKTNYGEYIKTDKATSGTAEIITKDRRLIQRLFDNLKYVIEK